jgi:hypothetical protein
MHVNSCSSTRSYYFSSTNLQAINFLPGKAWTFRGHVGLDAIADGGAQLLPSIYLVLVVAGIRAHADSSDLQLPRARHLQLAAGNG